MITAGDFNKRIIIRKAGANGGTDSEGYPIPGSNIDLKVWAMVKPVSAREYTQAKATQTERITRFVIRYRTGIDDSMKVVYKGSFYEIESVINDDEANKTLTIIASEVV